MSNIKLVDICDYIITGKIDANKACDDGIYPFFTCSEHPLRINTAAYDDDVIIIAGNGAFYMFRYQGKFNAYQRNYILRISENADKNYVYYRLLMELQSFRAKSRGSIIKFLTIGMIENVAIANIPKIRQTQLAAPLLALDSKIEHNKRMIDRLEKQAQLLYDYWFLQFDFPDENGRPYRSSGGKMVWNETLKREIPAGWKVKKLSNLIETLKTGKLDANAAEKDGKYPFFTCSAEPMRINSFSYDGDVIILSGNGEFYLFDYNGRFDVYQRNYVIRPKKGVCKQYLYQEIARNIRLLKSQAQGSIIKFLTKGMIEKIPVFDLDWKSHRVLEEVLRNLFARCSCLKKEIEVLTAQRDYLLPLLMTGQVRVEA